jgi:hypothetical protein
MPRRRGTLGRPRRPGAPARRMVDADDGPLEPVESGFHRAHVHFAPDGASWPNGSRSRGGCAPCRASRRTQLGRSSLSPATKAGTERFSVRPCSPMRASGCAGSVASVDPDRLAADMHHVGLDRPVQRLAQAAHQQAQAMPEQPGGRLLDAEEFGQPRRGRALGRPEDQRALLCRMMAKPQEDPPSGRGVRLGQAVDPLATRSLMAEVVLVAARPLGIGSATARASIWVEGCGLALPADGGTSRGGAEAAGVDRPRSTAESLRLRAGW